MVTAPCGFTRSFFHRNCLSEWWIASAKRGRDDETSNYYSNTGMLCPHCSVPMTPDAFLADMIHFHLKKLLSQPGFWASKPCFIRAQSGLVIFSFIFCPFFCFWYYYYYHYFYYISLEEVAVVVVVVSLEIKK